MFLHVAVLSLEMLICCYGFGKDWLVFVWKYVMDFGDAFCFLGICDKRCCNCCLCVRLMVVLVAVVFVFLCVCICLFHFVALRFEFRFFLLVR